MKISSAATYAFGVSVAIALLAGCSGDGGSQVTPGSAMAPAAHQTMGSDHGKKVDLKSLLVTPPRVKPNLNKKPMKIGNIKPNCCALAKTLFISDAAGGPYYEGGVYLYDFPSLSSLGALPEPPEFFLEPQGMCSDKSGNVYIANTASSTVDEYSHSGSFIAAMADPGQYPVGCAYDRSTGNLAVMNIISTSGGAGSVSIYNGGSLVTQCSSPYLHRMYFGGYEAGAGTLWVSGEDSSYYPGLNKMAPDCTFTQVNVPFEFPGTVQWSANTKTMVVGDQDTFYGPTFYWVDDNGNVVGETVLECPSSCDVVQATIKGPRLVAPDAEKPGVDIFPFPAGGAPIGGISADFIEPIGSAVSPDKGE